jgi:hypothetical protein
LVEKVMAGPVESRALSEEKVERVVELEEQ